MPWFSCRRVSPWRAARACAVGLLLGLLALLGAPGESAAAYTDGALWRENFESVALGSSWFDSNLRVREYTTGGIDGRILRATYVPTSKGSARINKRFGLGTSASSATLSFDVKLHSAFEFVKGGKMHGLGGGTGTTGCDPIDPNGWSVRMMWRPEGVPVLYIYHQDRNAACGDNFWPNRDFTFQRGRWYRVEIFVKVNSGVGTEDGTAQLYIDGELLVDAQNLNLSGNNNVKIDQFLFSTFYGGNDPSWSSSQKTYAYFDNFTVRPGKRIGGATATTCEIFEEGIYHKATNVCCDNACGSCGGSGCGSLPGGSANCCTGSIQDSGQWCLQDGVSAPCTFDESLSDPPRPPPPPSCPYYDPERGVWIHCP